MNQYRGTVVTGGYVYRGPDPSLQGQYFFADSRNDADPTNDNYWRFDIDDPFGTVENIDTLLGIPTIDVGAGGTHRFPVSFGEDAVGNLYIAYLFSNQVYRLVTDELLPGDYDSDGDVDDMDYQVWVDNFGSTMELDADGNGDGVVDAADYTVWRDNEGRTVHDLAMGGGAGPGGAVPEPAAVLLGIQWIGLMLLGVRRRGRMS